MFPTTTGTSGYRPSNAVYNERVADRFGFGDVIRKAREKRGWNQDRLGREAKKFALRTNEKKINKSTVSAVETNPFTSKFGTVCRLVAALGLTLAEIEEEVGAPFLPQADAAAVAKAAKLSQSAEGAALSVIRRQRKR
jgi:transcriptional regulator with XRE-family HTH domain